MLTRLYVAKMLGVKGVFCWQICYMSLAKRIALRLEALELSESEACRRAELAHTYIRDIRNGNKRSPRAETLKRLAKVLGTTSEWLLEGKGEQVVDPDLQRVIDVWADLDGELRIVINRLVDSATIPALNQDGKKKA